MIAQSRQLHDDRQGGLHRRHGQGPGRAGSFDTQRQRLNATLAAERAGLTRAAARRHLLTLAHLGYLETDGSWFWLSPKVLRLSGSYLWPPRACRAIQPTLNRLAGMTGNPSPPWCSTATTW